MNEPNSSFDDPLAAAFDADSQQHGADDQLRTAVFSQTVGVLRTRRRLKQCALAAGLLGCYLAGITTMGIWRAGGNHELPSIEGATMTATSKPVASDPLRDAPDAGRRQVAAAKPSGFESWRRIGDHYLRESGDISLAVAGYSEAINLASDEERRISPGQDNWILMALKDARAKERKHAYSQQN